MVGFCWSVFSLSSVGWIPSLASFSTDLAIARSTAEIADWSSDDTDATGSRLPPMGVIGVLRGTTSSYKK